LETVRGFFKNTNHDVIEYVAKIKAREFAAYHGASMNLPDSTPPNILTHRSFGIKVPIYQWLAMGRNPETQSA
jgi:hypothetical protein